MYIKKVKEADLYIYIYIYIVLPKVEKRKAQFDLERPNSAGEHSWEAVCFKGSAMPNSKGAGPQRPQNFRNLYLHPYRLI